MNCPYCNHSFPLTWRRYFRAPMGRHTCPLCRKPSRLKFRASHFSILILVGLALAIPGAIIASYLFGPEWRALGVIPGLFLILPLDRMFDAKYKKLSPIKGQVPLDAVVCAECKGIFKLEDMIAYNGLHICAGCKPLFLQKLAEGASLSGTAGDKPNKTG